MSSSGKKGDEKNFIVTLYLIKIENKNMEVLAYQSVHILKLGQMIMFLFLQKYFVAELAKGVVKG